MIVTYFAPIYKSRAKKRGKFPKMKQKQGKKWWKGLLSSLLCVPLAFGVLAGCGKQGDKTGDEGGTNNEDINPDGKDPTTDDSEDPTPEAEGNVTFTAMTETANLDAYAENALDKEIEYLLSLNADNLLYNFYANANLPAPDGAKRYGGWENSLIAGHTMGHYLSALAQAYANGGTSEEEKSQLDKRIKLVISELKKCQYLEDDAETGAKAGFLWGANATNKRNVEFQFDNVEQGKTDINTQAWVPWYTMHKILAGLIDMYTVAGNETALTIAKNLGTWVCNRVSKWSEATRKIVLSTEYGGMNDALYNLYAVTGEEKYAVAAHKFDEDIATQGTFAQSSMVERIISDDANYLQGQHANTTIPKVIGLLNGYIRTNGKTVDGVTANASGRTNPKIYLQVAEKFWTRVVEHHSYVTGGNSNDEHFSRDDSQWSIRSNINCETCNTYNMLKLSRMLFSVTKDKKYLDYYENTYINAILSSQNPDTGMTMYFQPMAAGYYKTYSTPENSFWCCTGSGMESMSKLNDSIYYDAVGATYVAMYMSSTYKTEGLSLAMTADLETSDEVKIEVKEGVTTLKLRRPDWTTKFEVKKNGETVSVAASDDFASVDAKKGDTVTLTLGKNITVHDLPNAEYALAFKYGPYVLSAELGTDNMKSGTHGWGQTIETPNALTGLKDSYTITAGSLATFKNNINTYMTRGSDGKFTLTGIEGGPLTYSIHYKQYTQRYGLYFRFNGTDDAPTDNSTDTVIETLQPGRGQYETEQRMVDAANSTGADSETSRYANAGGSFSYWVGVDKSKPDANFIQTSFMKDDNGKTVKMSVGSNVFYTATLNYKGTDSMYEVYLHIPKSIVEGAVKNTIDGAEKDRILVKIESNTAGRPSARVVSTFNTLTRELKKGGIAYFVDCGDYDPTTLSDGDSFGLYNSVTEQVYGADVGTGMQWGLVDNNAADIAGACQKGIGTNSTWAYEFASGDGTEKTLSNRYTKNQFESSVARNLHYKFEIPDGTYTVKMYFADPWNCSTNPNVSANGESKIQNGAIGEELSFNVTVTGGELTLDITTSDKCINLCYITILCA